MTTIDIQSAIEALRSDVREDIGHLSEKLDAFLCTTAVRIDRLEQRNKIINRLLIWGGGGFLGLLLDTAKHHFFH